MKIDRDLQLFTDPNKGVSADHLEWQWRNFGLSCSFQSFPSFRICTQQAVIGE
jgi:hypothetical protein